MLVEVIALTTTATMALAAPEQVERPDPGTTPSESTPGLVAAPEQDPAATTPAGPATVPSARASASELSEKLANPISDLISIPFQFNYDRGYGPRHSDRLTLNVQPVIPFVLNEDWSVITRTVVPLIRQESPAPGVEDAFALGDVLQYLLLSPRNQVSRWVIGAGPVILWPTGTDPSFRSESLGLGPAVVAL